MQARWEEASESYALLTPARQQPQPNPAAKQASIGGLLIAGVAIATLTKIGASPLHARCAWRRVAVEL